MGGLFLFLSLSAFTQEGTRTLIHQDVFVFKVNDQVYSLEDLKQLGSDFSTLNCLYEDSLLTKSFEKIISINQDQTNFKVSKNDFKFTESQKKNFRVFIHFAKLVNYMRSQKVRVKKGLVKAFYLASNELKCPKSIFKSSKQFTKNFEQIMKAELFLRSRFLPDEKSKTKKDENEAVKAGKALVETVDKQIQEEVFW